MCSLYPLVPTQKNRDQSINTEFIPSLVGKWLLVYGTSQKVYGATLKTLIVIDLVANRLSGLQFAWKTLTCLQKLTIYSLSAFKTVQSEVQIVSSK